VLLLSNAKKTVHMVDTAAKAAVLLQSGGGRLKGCHFSLDGLTAYLVPATPDDLLLVDVKNNKVSGKLSVATPPSRIGDLFIHPNPAKKLALLADGTRILYLDSSTHKPQGSEIALGAPVHSIAFHPNGLLFFALTDDKVFWIDLQTRQIQKSLELAPGGTFRSMTLDGQGRRLFVSGNHEINEGLGAVINTQGKEFVAVDVETRKKSYFDYAPVRTVEFVVSP
jgi:WD40 repeat protein